MEKQTPKTFWAKVKIGSPDECWPWDPPRSSERGDYGRVLWGGEMYASHRVAYSLHHAGDLSMARCRDQKSSVVRHTCDNPPCCNPNHLILGTAVENVVDAFTKERRVTIRGAEHANAALKVTDVAAIRATYVRYNHRLGVCGLAKRYGVSAQTIYRVVNDLRYRDEA